MLPSTAAKSRFAKSEASSHMNARSVQFNWPSSKESALRLGTYFGDVSGRQKMKHGQKPVILRDTSTTCTKVVRRRGKGGIQTDPNPNPGPLAGKSPNMGSSQSTAFRYSSTQRELQCITQSQKTYKITTYI